MSLDSRLAQLSDPNTSAKKKRQIMDQLQEETTVTKSSALGAAGGGLGAGLLSTVGGAAIAAALLRTKRFGKLLDPLKKEGKKAKAMSPKEFKEEVTDVAEGMPQPLKWFQQNYMEPKYRMLNNDTLAGRTDDIINEQARDMAAGITGSIGAMAGGYYGGKHWGDKTGPSQESVSALERMAAGDPRLANRYKNYYEGIQDGKGSGLAEYLGNAAVSVPLAYAFGVGGGERLGKMFAPDLKKSKLFKSETGRALAGEELGDLVLAAPLGSAVGSAAYNATSDPYTDPF